MGIDAEWLTHEAGTCMNMFSFDNHYLVGGQGDIIAEVIAKESLSKRNCSELALVKFRLVERIRKFWRRMDWTAHQYLPLFAPNLKIGRNDP